LNIADALIGVNRLYLDTAPLIYYVEENQSYIDRMDALIDHIEQASIVAVSSVITLTEVLNYPIRLGRSDLEQTYRNILLHNDTFMLMTVTAKIAESSAHLRARYNLRTPDALHLATALEASCQTFLTNDLALKRVQEIRVLALDELDTPST
jgi:predicted nucleic acid-binding protein